jgi:hypothetical protein
MYAVVVKTSARKRLCANGRIWVKDAKHPFYVDLRERGLWQTREEAEKMITEPWEIVVEVNDVRRDIAEVENEG